MIKIQDVLSKIPVAQIKNSLNNRIVQLVIAFLCGALVCTVVYPSKQIKQIAEQEYKVKLEEHDKQQVEIVQKITQEKNEIETKVSEERLQYESAMSSYESQIKEMSSKKEATTHKVTHPDGSTEEWTSTQSEDKTSQKIISEMAQQYQVSLQQKEEEMNKKNDSVRQEITSQYLSTIDSLKSEVAKSKQETVTTINPKKLGVEIGATTELRAYVHGTYNILGPFFIGSQLEGNDKNFSAGIGIGINL